MILERQREILVLLVKKMHWAGSFWESPPTLQNEKKKKKRKKKVFAGQRLRYSSKNTTIVNLGEFNG
jgi:hypothetical protein